VCGRSIADVVRAIRWAVDVAGIDHVALGSDFDGAVATPFDATGLPALTQALLDGGFDTEAVERIVGGNALRYVQTTLGDGRSAH